MVFPYCGKCLESSRLNSSFAFKPEKVIDSSVHTGKPTTEHPMLQILQQNNGISSPDRVSQSLPIETIEKFLIEIKKIPSHQLTLETFKDLVTSLHLSKEFWEAFVLFLPDKYGHQILFRNDDVEALVMCWGPGQASGIHLHKHSALNVTKVLYGEITQQRYIADEKRKLFCWKEETVSAGEITFTDRYEWHQLVNKSGEDCVSLNLYAPVRN
jgi:predicted metal-dependent enzyme (double-stranded beta helix superfamily)